MKTSEAANLVFQWTFVLNSVKHARKGKITVSLSRAYHFKFFKGCVPKNICVSGDKKS